MGHDQLQDPFTVASQDSLLHHDSLPGWRSQPPFLPGLLSTKGKGVPLAALKALTGSPQSLTYMLKAPRASQVALVVKNLPASAGDGRNMGSIPGSGRSPGEGNGDPLQYSCLENSKDRGAWQATVHRVAKSQTRLK